MNFSNITLSDLELIIQAAVDCKLHELEALGKTMKDLINKNSAQEHVDSIASCMGSLAAELLSLDQTLTVSINKISRYKKLYPALIERYEEMQRREFYRKRNMANLVTCH